MPPVRGKRIFKRKPAIAENDDDASAKEPVKNGTKEKTAGITLEAVIELVPKEETKKETSKKPVGNIFESMCVELSSTEKKPEVKTTPTAKTKTTPATKAKTPPAAKAKAAAVAKEVKVVEEEELAEGDELMEGEELLEGVELVEGEELGEGEELADDGEEHADDGEEGDFGEEDEEHYEGEFEEEGMDDLDEEVDTSLTEDATDTVVKTEDADTSKTEEKTEKKADKSDTKTTEKEKDGYTVYEPEPYPESFNKLRQLTVNIGPVKQQDLMSLNLHKVLSLCPLFDIKFELKEIETGTDKKIKRTEKLGYIRIPFEIGSPNFLLLISNRLGSLNIDGRDMSVKFPEEFNDAIKDARAYVDRNGKMKFESRKWLVDMRKRQIVIKGVPESVTEEQVKELYPELVRMEMKRSFISGKPYMVKVEFADEATANKKLEKKDLKIDDVPVKLGAGYNPKPTTFTPRGGRGARGFRGQGRGIGRGGFEDRGARAPLLTTRGRGMGGMMRGTGRGFVRGTGMRGVGMRGVGMRGAIRGRGAGFPTMGDMVADRDNRQKMQLMERQQRAIAQQMSNLASIGMRGVAFGANPVDMAPAVQRAANMDQRSFTRGNEGFNDVRPTQDMAARRDMRGIEMRGGRPEGYSGSWDEGRREDDRRRDARARPSEEDPRAVMDYLKTTLAKMEDKISHTGAGRQDEYRQPPKRKVDYEDYNRGDTKRQYGGPSASSAYDQRDQRDRDQRDSYGRSTDYAVPAQRDDYQRPAAYGDRVASSNQYAAGYDRGQTSGGGNYGNQGSFGGAGGNQGRFESRGGSQVRRGGGGETRGFRGGRRW